MIALPDEVTAFRHAGPDHRPAGNPGTVRIKNDGFSRGAAYDDLPVVPVFDLEDPGPRGGVNTARGQRGHHGTDGQILRLDHGHGDTGLIPIRMGVIVRVHREECPAGGPGNIQQGRGIRTVRIKRQGGNRIPDFNTGQAGEGFHKGRGIQRPGRMRQHGDPAQAPDQINPFLGRAEAVPFFRDLRAHPQAQDMNALPRKIVVNFNSRNQQKPVIRIAGNSLMVGNGQDVVSGIFIKADDGSRIQFAVRFRRMAVKVRFVKRQRVRKHLHKNGSPLRSG